MPNKGPWGMGGLGLFATAMDAYWDALAEQYWSGLDEAWAAAIRDTDPDAAEVDRC